MKAGLWPYAFGHTRLAIIDVESGQQPMASNCGRYVIVFNGEIYNYVELRSEILVSNFSTLSDTEVIIEAFKVWGENCVEKLRGMFAFAIWDQKNQSLFLARDRFGIKPLYFHENDDGLYFSSELKGVLPFLRSVEINRSALSDYLICQLPLDNQTLVSGVCQLDAAHFGYFTPKTSLSCSRYWQVNFRVNYE